jgi:uncharacterized protein (TIGR02588 family)
MGTNVKSKPPILEWVASGIGLVLTMFLILVIGWEGIRGSKSVPSISVNAVETVRTNDGFTVRIVVRNDGSETASDVVVEGELRRGDEIVETRETTFPYVPGKSEREGGLFFSGDPRKFDVILNALGYTAP